MKHLLNNLSEEEKNRIREQHEGGMKVNTEKFKSLLESKSGNVKPLLKESSLAGCANPKKAVELAAPSFKNCFNDKDYPNLVKASDGSLRVIWGLLLIKAGIASEFLTFGLSTIGSVAIGATGVASTAIGIRNIYDANISKIGDELEKLFDCVFGLENELKGC